MDQFEDIRQFLNDLGKYELAALLHRGTYRHTEIEGVLFEEPAIEFFLPPSCAEALEMLSNQEQDHILSAVKEACAVDNPQFFSIDNIIFTKDSDFESDPHTDTLARIIYQRELLKKVATGGPRINSVNDQYKVGRQRLQRDLQKYNIEYTNPFDDLWAWFGKWKNSPDELGTYHSRRLFIDEMFQPMIDQLIKAPEVTITTVEPTGWARVDRGLHKCRIKLGQAKDPEDFQSVGLLCREVLHSLADAIYDPEIHGKESDVKISPTDFKRICEEVLNHELGGHSAEKERKFAKSALDLANDLQHSRSADYRKAALCVEATSSTVNIIAILLGKRDRA